MEREGTVYNCSKKNLTFAKSNELVTSSFQWRLLLSWEAIGQIESHPPSAVRELSAVITLECTSGCHALQNRKKSTSSSNLTFDIVQVWFVSYRLTVFSQLLFSHLNKLRHWSMAGQGSPDHARRHSAAIDFDVGDAKVQHYGLLMKKPFAGGQKSGRWQKR